MASKTDGLIQKISSNNITHSIASTAYGICETAATEPAKTVEMTGFTLLEGTTVHIKFINSNTAANPTLNINATGAKPIVQYNSVPVGTTVVAGGWTEGSILTLTYDETNWVVDTTVHYNYSLNDLKKKALTTSTINTNNTTDLIYSSSSGKFFGHTSGIDWAGIQIGASNDRFQLIAQLIADSNTLIFRQNDKTSVSASTWGAWQQFAHTPFVGGLGGAGAIGSKIEGEESVATPVYVTTDGTIAPIAYTIGADVPIGAKFTDTTYTGENGISLNGTIFSNSGVRNITTGTSNGTIKANINGTETDISVAGLQALAYKDALTASDIPNLSWNKITSNKPTTLSGYGITDAKITSGTITLGSNTISPVTAIAWDSNNKKLTHTVNDSVADVVTADTLRTALGLSNALHFIGVTSTSLSDGSTTSTLTAKSTDSLTKTTDFVDGDIVMDGDQLREYVWSGSAWRLLGITTSTAYSKTTSENTFISSISQGTDGKITADSRALDTSGTWSGTATTATKLSAAPTITQAGSSGTNLSAATLYTLTVGGQTVIFKTPADTNDKVTQNVKTDNKKYGIILSNYETSASTTTAAAVNRDSKVYVNPSLNSVNAGQFVLHDKAATPVEKAYMVWNTTDQSIDFVFN